MHFQLFGILGLFIESPTWWLTKVMYLQSTLIMFHSELFLVVFCLIASVQKVQLKIFFYARFLRRTSGRALFYFSVSLCCFAGVNETGVNVTMFAGVYMIGVSLLMLVFGKLAAKQLHEMSSYMRHNGQIDGDHVDNIDNFKEDPDAHLKERLMNYYTQIDSDRTDKIGSKELHNFATQALKRNLSNSGMLWLISRVLSLYESRSTNDSECG